MLAIVEHVWEAEADDSSYVIKEQTYPEKVLTRGTQTTLYLRDDDKYEFTDPARIESLVKNCSQFVSFSYIHGRRNQEHLGSKESKEEEE